METVLHHLQRKIKFVINDNCILNVGEREISLSSDQHARTVYTNANIYLLIHFQRCNFQVIIMHNGSVQAKDDFNIPEISGVNFT
ncbi:hypothetical protein V1478_018176 [Vespula squamosa]|uniref:Uncharacterized protein n=1 Tax=Vespula squamosa TaxID=30214 RepID=A0ABD1ZUA7_VESSQ